MKKYIYILFASLGFLASCEEEVVRYDDQTGPAYLRFSAANIDLPIVFDSTAEIDIPVLVSTLSDVDRTVAVNVVTTGAENEATPDQFSVGNTVTIPANSYRGILPFTGIDNGIEIGDTKTVTLEINEISGDAGADLDAFSTTIVSLFQVCPVDPDFFIGEYELTTTVPGIFGIDTFAAGDRDFGTG